MMDRWDTLICLEWIVVIVSLVFAYTILIPTESKSPQQSMENMKRYVEETGIEMQDVQLILQNDTLDKPEGTITSEIDYDNIFGYALYRKNESKIHLRDDQPNKISVLAHEYAHQVRFNQGDFGEQHGTPEFIFWRYCLYFSIAFDKNLCKW